MSEKSLVRSLEQSMAVKSLKDLVRVRDAGNVVLLIDVSFSMTDHMRNGKKRIEGLREVVKGMQEKKPTRMIAFGLHPGKGRVPTELERAFGIPTEGDSTSPFGTGPQVGYVETVPDAQGGTPLAEGIDFARTNGHGRAVVISDGEPNDPHAAMAAAKAFGGRIDVVFVGDPGTEGSVFLENLAKSTGGIRFEGDLSEVKEIIGAVVGLLTGGVELEEDDEDDEDDDDVDLDDEDEDEDDEEDDDAS